MAQSRPKLHDLKISEFSLQTAKSPEFQRLLKVLAVVAENPLDLLPIRTKHSVDFTVSNASSALANALRRCLIEELPVKALDVDQTSISTNDAFILPDVIQTAINQLPLLQDCSDADIANATLNITNNTCEIITIFSHDIAFPSAKSEKLSSKPGKSGKSENKRKSSSKLKSTTNSATKSVAAKSVAAKSVVAKSEAKSVVAKSEAKLVVAKSEAKLVAAKPEAKMAAKSAAAEDSPAKLLLERNIPIAVLHPGKKISITNFKIIEGIGNENAGAFGLLNNIRYAVSDMQLSSSDRSSTSDFTEFKIGYTTFGTVEPLTPLKLCCETMIKRLQDAAEQIKIPQIKNPSDDINIIALPNEYWTIANLISKYCYLQNTNIPFVCAAITHPSSNGASIKIKHPEWQKIYSDACARASADIATLLQSLQEK